VFGIWQEGNKLNEEFTVNITRYSLICFDDFLDFMLDEEVERIDMLFN